MRVHCRATSVSWIPSESVTSGMRTAFDHGVSRYDPPPPETLASLEDLRIHDAFRFANVHDAWAEFDDSGSLVDSGFDGELIMGSSTVRFGNYSFTAAGVSMPTLRSESERGSGTVTLRQTAGGRTGMPLPRAVRRPPFIQLTPPLVWTTLSITLRADGTSSFALTGASDFPRHWVYGPDDHLALKAGVATWSRWLGQGSWRKTPWGDADSAPVVAAAETDLERRLSALIMHGGSPPRIRSCTAGEVVMAQGSVGDTLFLVLDGVVRVDVDGTAVAELGPGTVLGERAILAGGVRTATATAVTEVRLAEVPATSIDRAALERLTEIHRREEAPGAGAVVDG
jgi:hypothetical protein